MEDDNGQLLPVMSVFMTSILLVLASELAKCGAKRRKVRQGNIRLLNKHRIEKGFYKTIFCAMKSSDPMQFFKYTRMDKKTFEKLVLLLTPALKKHTKHMPNNIYIEERIALTLQ